MKPLARPLTAPRIVLGLAAASALVGLSGAGCTDGTTPDDSATAACDCGAITSFTAASSAGNVLARELKVSLEAADQVDVTCTLTQAPPSWHLFVTAHDDWQYLDDGSDPADGWTQQGHDSSGWSVGRAPLGYGDEANTVIDLDASTGDGSITAWFRVEFEIGDPSEFTDLEVSWQRDDGIRLTLNGTEIARDNMPDGDLTSATGALEKLSGGDEDVWSSADASASLLVAGTNVLAAEVHQYDKYSEDLSFDGRLLARRAPPATPPDEVHVLSSDACRTSHTLGLEGLLSEATYSCEAVPACGGDAHTVEVVTEALPDILPRLALHQDLSNDLSGTWTLFTHTIDCAEDYANRLVAVDPEGQIRWYWTHPTLDASSTADIEAEVLPNGTILVGGGEHKYGAPLILNQAGETLYTTDYDGVADNYYHHDLQWQDDQILGLVEAEFDDAGLEIEGFGFVRHDPDTDDVTWRWDNIDAHFAGTMPRTTNPDNADDPYHANSIAGTTDSDGPGVYVSLLHANVILRIDETTGDQSWVLGKRGDFALVDSSGASLDDEGWFSGMHAIDVFGDHLWVYDNGLSNEYTRALMYTLDTSAMTATLGFEYKEASWHEPVWGDADELDGGHVLVNMSHAWCKGGNKGHFGGLVEFEIATAEPIWRLDFLDQDDASYRSQRVDGCALFPANSRYCD